MHVTAAGVADALASVHAHFVHRACGRIVARAVRKDVAQVAGASGSQAVQACDGRQGEHELNGVWHVVCTWKSRDLSNADVVWNGAPDRARE